MSNDIKAILEASTIEVLGVALMVVEENSKEDSVVILKGLIEQRKNNLASLTEVLG